MLVIMKKFLILLTVLLYEKGQWTLSFIHLNLLCIHHRRFPRSSIRIQRSFCTSTRCEIDSVTDIDKAEILLIRRKTSASVDITRQGFRVTSGLIFWYVKYVLYASFKLIWRISLNYKNCIPTKAY